MTDREIKRIENVEVSYTYETYCTVCSKPITLWWNGGELDSERCCGHVYRLEHGPVDFVVAKEEE